jgi:hypothetical protein
VNLRVLSGRLLVLRDPDETFVDVAGVRIFFPDDMASSGVNSWAASDRRRCSGFCLLHQPSFGWYNDPMLTGHVVYFTKWSERTFELGGQTFCLIDEGAVFAYGRDTHMRNFKEVLVELTDRLGPEFPAEELEDEMLDNLAVRITEEIDSMKEGEEDDEDDDDKEPD